ncbi:MAG TPA: site-specific integrase, partial [Candidatus Limnocylindrales bacterium]|nr:site-specific integrase [Candidatus Limnocylindrales bacterium]
VSCIVQYVGDVEEHVHVQRVLSPVYGVESWTVLGDDGSPIGPVERFLAYLSDIERSLNTVKAYAHDLKDYWSYLAFRGLDWREVRLEDVGEFVAWLQLPPAARDGRVTLLPTARAHVGAATVNRKLSAVAAFYVHHGRNGGARAKYRTDHFFRSSGHGGEQVVADDGGDADVERGVQPPVRVAVEPHRARRVVWNARLLAGAGYRLGVDCGRRVETAHGLRVVR